MRIGVVIGVSERLLTLVLLANDGRRVHIVDGAGRLKSTLVEQVERFFDEIGARWRRLLLLVHLMRRRKLIVAVLNLSAELLIEALLFEAHERLVAHDASMTSLAQPLEITSLQEVDHLDELGSRSQKLFDVYE